MGACTSAPEPEILPMGGLRIGLSSAVPAQRSILRIRFRRSSRMLCRRLAAQSAGLPGRSEAGNLTDSAFGKTFGIAGS
jgi:hypothetical protein